MSPGRVVLAKSMILSMQSMDEEIA